MLDIKLTGGYVIDGSGSPMQRRDIGILDGKIAAVGDLRQECAKKTICADGLIVTPGFIDAHCHTDHFCADFPDAEGKVMQGVTSDVCGLCGSSPAPEGERFSTFSEFRDFMNHQGTSTNLACFVGNANLRSAFAGTDDRKAGRVQLKSMCDSLAGAMRDGAWGLSTGLTYVPSQYSDTDELIALSAAMNPWGGIYNSHMRNEGLEVFAAIEEVIRIAQFSGCQGHISHLKIAHRKNHGRAERCLALIDGANRRGIRVGFDVYPYTAGSTALNSLLPPELRQYSFGGGVESVPEEYRLALRKRLEMNDWDNLVEACGWDRLMIGADGADGRYDGKSLAQIALEKGCRPEEALLEILDGSRGAATMVYHCIAEEDLETFLRHPGCMLGTDAFARHYTGPTALGKPHPRNYGAFPRFIRRYLLERELMPLEEGIRRITSLPARTFGIPERGLIRPGFCADLTAFDPKTVRETGTYENPAQKPEGICYVLISGEKAVSRGEFRPVRAGRMLAPRPRIL